MSSGRRRAVCFRDEDSKDGARISNVPQTPSPDLQRSSSSLGQDVAQSPTCRKIFFDDSFKVAPFPEATFDVMEQQKLKWNFDFQSETPLPGRYLWVSTKECSGYCENGKETSPPQLKSPPLKRGKRKYAKSASVQMEGLSGGSCDRALNESSESRKSIRLNEPALQLNWT